MLQVHVTQLVSLYKYSWEIPAWIKCNDYKNNQCNLNIAISAGLKVIWQISHNKDVAVPRWEPMFTIPI